MSVGLLLITHRPLGSDLLRVATEIFGTCPTRTGSLEVENDASGEQVLAEAQRLAERLDTGDGLLVLTDIYGATPANLAISLCANHPRRRVLAGVNLPMLLRALNYAGLDLEALADKALAGGREGVRQCPGPDGQE
ncbi:PTS fructose transporter subunit IIA [uncultured Thiodictyon sp.]|uniref:PTS sugar transporter subunit IIA n=1 Tax=uncultured Thiodictyon sp. TaxID=1846217 RepID=UPI0025F0EAAF|nr:PTS fructose transporter subunit IIA [uncultured Thiodictyon sp.]